MFRLRVHSVDLLYPAEDTGGATTSNPAPPPSGQNPNPRIQVRRGVIHLYHPTRSPSASSSSSLCHPPLESLLPSQRSTVIFALAVPTRVSLDDFLRFCHPYSPACEILIIRNNAVEDVYSVVVRFDEQESADGFYCEFNGLRLSDTEPEVCHFLFLDLVEFTEYTEIASTPPIGFTELPTCPACLEKLDQDISGIVATTFDQCFPSTSKWFNSSCSVCQFLQKHTQKATCSTCHTSKQLWICLICGFVGCGRYKQGHARDHWGHTHHCYVLDLHAKRIWDCVGNTYVHRLNQSRSDGKFQSHFKLKDEYNRLLANTLDEQKQRYEALLSKIEEAKEKNISEAVETALSLRLQDIQLKLENSNKERKIAADTNEELMKSQSLLREKIKEIEERMLNLVNNVTGAPSEKRKGTPNKRWTKEMDNVLIPLLADMARSGLKVDKSFKRQAFIEAASVVNNRFPVAFIDADNVENHVRTLKQKYQDIKKLMSFSGVGWNDSEKMLVLKDETYRTYVEGQSKAKEYLNKPIHFFEELRLVAGDDHATGDHARSIYDQFSGTILEDIMPPPPTNEPMNCEAFEVNSQRYEARRTATSNTPATRTCRTSRNIVENPTMDRFGDKVGDLAGAIDRSRRTWKEKFSDALWDMEGYDDDDMEMVFNILVNDKKQAENFYLRKPSLRKRWLNNFIAQMKNSSP